MLLGVFPFFQCVRAFSPRRMYSVFCPKKTAPEMPEKPRQFSSLYFRNLSASLCNIEPPPAPTILHLCESPAHLAVCRWCMMMKVQAKKTFNKGQQCFSICESAKSSAEELLSVVAVILLSILQISLLNQVQHDAWLRFFYTQFAAIWTNFVIFKDSQGKPCER